MLDIVYNHLGPEGNYVAEFAPYFTDACPTPWGSAINFDGPGSDGVRAFFVEKALYWLREFHIDALRLDAVHGIFGSSAQHFLDELSDSFHAEALHLNRKAWLIAESNQNDARLARARRGGYGIDAVWSYDFHHSLHASLTGAAHLYLGDSRPFEDLGKALREGFVYDGRIYWFRQKHYGSPSGALPGKSFVVFMQNHDQVGNTWLGRRMSELVSPAEYRVAAALLLFSPYLPLLFMGEEYGESAPFLFAMMRGRRGAVSWRTGREIIPFACNCSRKARHSRNFTFPLCHFHSSNSQSVLARSVMLSEERSPVTCRMRSISAAENRRPPNWRSA